MKQTAVERIKFLIKELEQGNPHTNEWIIEELNEILLLTFKSE